MGVRGPLAELKIIDFTYSVAGKAHRFASADGSIIVERLGPRRAAKRLAAIILALPDGPFHCCVEGMPFLSPAAGVLGRAMILAHRYPEQKREFSRARTKPTIEHADLPPPAYPSWEDYLARTTYAERMKRCYAASKRANRTNRQRDGSKLTGMDVWSVQEAAKGRCFYCRSLAVENRPSHPQTGAPVQWAHMGRRIGSLEHKDGLPGQRNHISNLEWACLWCNTEYGERIPYSPDFGGYYPDEG